MPVQYKTLHSAVLNTHLQLSGTFDAITVKYCAWGVWKQRLTLSRKELHLVRRPILNSKWQTLQVEQYVITLCSSTPAMSEIDLTEPVQQSLAALAGIGV